MSWFEDLKSPKIKETPGAEKRASRIPDGMWVKCKVCERILQTRALQDNQEVCPHCAYHFRLPAAARIRLLSDSDATFVEFDHDIRTTDPLEFFDLKSYEKRLHAARDKTKLSDAVITGETRLAGVAYALGVFVFEFMGGSMGGVVGEKITRLFEHAVRRGIPAVVVTSTGGARMQEGIISLMQMAKTSALVHDMKTKRIPFITLLTDPTTGGVAASFAMQADIILAEPRALIGFAGPRVIEQAMKVPLPEGFQTAEFLLEHGFIDKIINRKDLPETLGRLLRLHAGRNKWQPGTGVDVE